MHNKQLLLLLLLLLTASTTTTTSSSLTTSRVCYSTVKVPSYLKPFKRYNSFPRKLSALRPVRAVTMPSFELVEPIVRRLEPDEEYVVVQFERHATGCSRCSDALKTFDKGSTLCDRGNLYAVDVDKYIYSSNHKAHSSVDRDCNQATLLQLSTECQYVHRLLLAIEYGLQLRAKREDILVQPRTPSPARPVISYDRTYHVAPRLSVSPPRYTHEIIERVPHSNKSRRVIVYPSSSSRGSSSTRASRGSYYYDDDVAPRVGRIRDSPRSSGPIDYEYYR